MSSQEKIVKVSAGAGTQTIDVKWQEGDTVSTVLRRAEVTVKDGHTATLGRKKVKNPDKTKVNPSDVIVVEGQPRNG